MSQIPHFDGVFEAALEIAKNRCALMNALRAALHQCDDQTALRLARQLIGIEPAGHFAAANESQRVEPKGAS
jgi:hypothetical protein